MKRQQMKLLLHIGTTLAIACSMVPTMASPARAAAYITLDPEYGPRGTEVKAKGSFNRGKDERFCGIGLHFDDIGVFDYFIDTDYPARDCRKSKGYRDALFNVPDLPVPKGNLIEEGEHRVRVSILLYNTKTARLRSVGDSTTFWVGKPPLVDCDADAKPNPDVSSGKAEASGKADCDTPNGGDADAPAAAEADASQTEADVQTEPEADRR